MSKAADKHLERWAPLLIALFVVLAYLPLSSFRFALKNDAYLYNFPNKFFFSEALHAGNIPFWNPYLNGGFPLFADPGFAWWHPLTWLFGVIGYNAYTFTAEVICYIFLGGWGMYQLCRGMGRSVPAAIVGGCMFSACGFFTGNLQHINFLTCAAFLPWLLWCLLRFYEQSTFRRLIVVVLAAYLFCTGGHPAIPIAALYCLGAFIATYTWYNQRQISASWFWRNHLLLLILFLALLAIPLWSWLSLLPQYSRQALLNQEEHTRLGFTFSSLISLISPLPTARNPAFFATDVSMRNAYCSVVGLLILLASRNNITWKPELKALLAMGLTGFLLSLGGALKAELFGHLPLLGYIKSNGEFRVFWLLPLVASSAAGMDMLLSGDTVVLQRLRSWTKLVMSIALLALCAGVIVAATTFSAPVNSASATLKKMLDEAHPAWFWSAGALITLVVSGLLYRLTGRKPAGSILLLICADLLINAWAMLPITGVGQTSTRQMQAIFNKAPKGFPLPQTAAQNKYVPSERELTLIGDWGWYDKNPVKAVSLNYPSALVAERAPLQGESLLSLKLPQYNELIVTGFTSNTIRVQTSLKQADTLLLLQHYYSGWTAWVDGKEQKVLRSPDGFMQVPVQAGNRQVVFRFSPFH